MEANQFDNNAKNRLSKHQSQLDVDSFWDQLEPKLPKDKSRTKIFILFLIAGLLLCSGLLGWYLFEKNKQQDSVVNSNALANQVNKSETDIKEFGNHASNTSDVKRDNASKFSQVDDAEMNENKDKSIQQDNKEAISKAGLKTSVANVNSKYTPKKAKVDDRDKIEKQTAKRNDLNNGKANESSSGNPGNLYTDYLTKNFVLKNQTNSNDKNQSENIHESSNDKSTSSTEQLTQEQIESAMAINYLPLLSQLLQVKNLFIDLNFESVPAIEKLQALISPKKDNLRIDLLPIIGIGYYTKNLNYSGTDNLADYVNLRKRAESNLEEWLFGLNVNLSYGQFGLLTGIEYVKRNEKFNFSLNKTDNLFGTTEIRVETNDSFNIISGTGWHGSTQIRKVVHYNSIQQWNVPLGLNYHFSLQGLRLTIGAGAMFSISNKINGKTLDRGLNVADWNKSPDLSYNTNLGVGWYGELSCTFPIANRIAFNTGFRVQEFPGNYLTGPLELNYRSYLLRSGLVISLR